MLHFFQAPNRTSWRTERGPHAAGCFDLKWSVWERLHAVFTGDKRPVDGNGVYEVPEGIVDAQLKVVPRRKLHIMLKCEFSCDEHLNVWNMIEVYNKTFIEKRGVRCALELVPSNEKDDQFGTLPDKADKRVTEGIENICLVLPDEPFTSSGEAAIGDVYASIAVSMPATENNFEITDQVFDENSPSWD